MQRVLFLFIGFCLGAALNASGQKPAQPTEVAPSGRTSRIELQHADVLEFAESINKNADRLIGHVAFKHENAVMTCDSAYLFKNENNMEAFGNVRINQGDTVTVTSKHLLYIGDSQL